EIYTLSLHDALPIFVVGEVDCELLSVGDFRGYLHGKIGLIFAGEYLVGYEVQDLCELHGVMLADGKNDRLADLPLIGSRSAFLEDLIGGFGKEAFLKLALLVDLLLVVAFVILELDDEAILGKKLGCDLAAGIHNNRVDQEAVFHSIQ